MKTLIFSLLLCFWGAVTAPAQNNCDGPPAVRAFYQEDALQLAARMMQNNPQWQDSVEIPTFLYNRAMRALLAVYNATQLHERDTVVECLAIHTFPTTPLHGVALGMNAGQAWVQNFHAGVFPTGNTAFDDLMAHYGLTKNSSFQVGNSIYGSLHSDVALNMTALAPLFNGIPGVDFAETEGIVGGGNDIQLQETLIEDVELTYKAAWGDCPAGCIYSRNWKFRVKLDCGVQFLEVWGSELNQEISCNNSFECATEPLCLDWLRDTLGFYFNQFPECNLPNYGSVVALHEQGSVIGLHFVIGADFEFTRFYLCSGTYLGQCLITIAGQHCDSPNFENYFAKADTIWRCDQPLPSLEDCGILRAPEPPSWAGSVQVTPNPSTGIVQLSALLNRQQKGTLQVLNVLGQVLISKNFQATFINESIDLQGNAPGVYFVKLESEGKVVTKPVVITD